MKKVKFLILTTLLTLPFFNCDDGDVIISNFEFEEDDLEHCYSENGNQTVFFIENDNNEVFYIVVNNEYDFLQNGITEFKVTSDNISNDQALVRSVKFNSIDADDYFCNAVASNVTIENEVIGLSGTVVITTEEFYNTNEDDDNDGLTNEDEDLNQDDDFTNDDTDGDGIPNFQDEDDDNDTIMTMVEISTSVLDEDETLEEGEFPDTDNDGVPNYLDDDDDDDGVLTRFEYSEGTSGPTEDVQINKTEDGSKLIYLDSNYSDIETRESNTRSNSYTLNYKTAIRIEDFQGDSETYDETTSIGEFEESEIISKSIIYDENGDYLETLNNNNNDENTEVPTAVILTSGVTGTVPFSITLSALESARSSGDTLTYTWTFDDGTTETGITTNVTFNTSGTYTIQLTVANSNGDIDLDTITITAIDWYNTNSQII